MLRWLGGAIYSTSWYILALATVIVTGAAIYGTGVADKLSSDVSGPNSQSRQASDILAQKFKADNVDVLILFESKDSVVTDLSFKNGVNDVLTPVRARHDVTSVLSYYDTQSTSLVATDNRSTYALVRFTDTADKRSSYAAILNSLPQNGPLKISLGGFVAADEQFSNQVSSDLARTEIITFPVIAILLVIVFGGLVATVLPLIVGGIAIAGALAILRLMTNFTQISVYAVNIVTVLGLGLAIDYALFIVTRFREELAIDDTDVRGALQRTMSTAGRTVFFSGLTVSMSLLGLTLFPILFLRSMGIGSIAAVLIAMLSALTILPAALSVLGKRVNALSLQRLFRRNRTVAKENAETQGGWYRLSQFVMRFPVPVIVAVVAFLVLLGSPFVNARFAAPDIRALPQTQSARYVYDQLAANFAQESGSQFDVAVVVPGDVMTATNLSRLNDYVQQVANVAHVTKVDSLVTLDSSVTLSQYQQIYTHPGTNPQFDAVATRLVNGGTTKVTVHVDVLSSSVTAKNIVTALRQVAPPAGVQAYISGAAADQIDLLNALTAQLPQALLVIVLATFVLLFVMTGSLVVPLKAVLLNVLSLTATFGAIVFIFQEGHGQQILHFQNIGTLDASQLVLLFAIAFGLSMDYEVFLLSRIKEEFDKSGDNRLAVATGLQHTGWLITSAAALLGIVMLATATSQIIFIQEIGLGLAIAVIMDATLVRALLVPATMRLLGKWNWWPRARSFGERS